MNTLSGSHRPGPSMSPHRTPAQLSHQRGVHNTPPAPTSCCPGHSPSGPGLPRAPPCTAGGGHGPTRTHHPNSKPSSTPLPPTVPLISTAGFYELPVWARPGQSRRCCRHTKQWCGTAEQEHGQAAREPEGFGTDEVRGAIGEDAFDSRGHDSAFGCRQLAGRRRVQVSNLPAKAFVLKIDGRQAHQRGDLPDPEGGRCSGRKNHACSRPAWHWGVQGHRPGCRACHQQGGPAPHQHGARCRGVAGAVQCRIRPVARQARGKGIHVYMCQRIVVVQGSLPAKVRRLGQREAIGERVGVPQGACSRSQNPPAPVERGMASMFPERVGQEPAQ